MRDSIDAMRAKTFSGRRRSQPAEPGANRRIYGRIETLEVRALLSVGAGAVTGPYCLPPQNELWNAGGYLSEPAGGEPRTIALGYLSSHAADLGLFPDDLAHAIVTDQYTDPDTGITHIYLRQELNSLEVANANINVNVTADGRILSAGGGFVSGLGLQPASAPVPAIAATEAVAKAAAALGLKGDAAPMVVVAGKDGSLAAAAAAGATTVVDSDASLDPIPVRLHYVATPGGIQLAWDMVLRTPDGQHWYDLSVDARSGETLLKSDWVDNASYNVYARPTENPDDGSRSVVVNPEDRAASPYGWHDTNGIAGAEYTDTRGNNVSAQDDWDDNDIGGARPDGGPGLAFNPPIDLAQEPATYHDAAITNLFYWNNLCHDIHDRYGFTEAAGNFQTINYTGQGAGGDAVQADAQDGSGTDNANFATPPDGVTPRMQMYLSYGTTPYRDGDLDALVMVHEYGHGVSTRLTGGPANSDSLGALQSGGMGEGWSDWWGLMFTQKTTDTKSGSYPVGTYTFGSNIRRQPYSYDMTVDNITMAAYNTSNEPHDVGEIWCSTLWDLNWLLIDRYGFNPDITRGYTGAGSAGNVLALKLVMDGLKLQPANPTFLQARDAILQADQVLTGGANQRIIWTAFARRGFGYSANAGADADAASVTQAFDLPPALRNPGVLSHSPVGVATSAVGSIDFKFSEAMVPGSFDPALDVASFTGPGGLILKSQIIGGTWLNGNTTLRITFPAQSTNGQYTMVIGPNILAADNSSPMDQNGDGTAGAAQDQYSASFRYDSAVMQVTSTSPANGSTLTPAGLSFEVNFSEPIDPASVSADDLDFSQGYVTACSVVDADTVQFTVTGIAREGIVTVAMAAGAVTDVNGNPMSAYSGSFTVDLGGTAPFPTPLNAEKPAGCLVYDGSVTGLIGSATDVDSYTLDLNGGQTVSLLVDVDTALWAVVELRDPSNVVIGSATAAAAGKDVVLQSVAVTASGAYKITLSSAASTTGWYALGVTAGAALELESHDGASNDTRTTAQNIDAGFTAVVGAARLAAVLGKTDVANPPTEIEPNDSRATALAMAGSFTAYTGNLYQLAAKGTISASGDADYFKIGALDVGDVITASLSGSPSSRGTLSDPELDLYRYNNGSYTLVTYDSDSGPGYDALLFKYKIATADTYYLRASGFLSDTGSYDLGVWLENTGTAPATGGAALNETESNNTGAAANDFSSSWRQVQYRSRFAGAVLTTDDTDYYAFHFTAGDRVSVNLVSTNFLAASVALLNSAGTVIAWEDGSSDGPVDDSPLYGFSIPSDGTYYLEAQIETDSPFPGGYCGYVYLSGSIPPAAATPGVDYYAVSLAAGEAASVALSTAAGSGVHVTLENSAGTTVATGAAGAVNVDETISDYVAPAAGTYYVRVAGTTAIINYNLVVTRGAEFDTDPRANDSLATAQAISTTGTVLGSVLPSSTLVTVASENFESGMLGPAWSVASSDATYGRIQVTDAWGTGAGPYALIMDTLDISGATNRNEAVWTVNLSGLSQATLSFSHVTFTSDATAFSGDFTGSADADGIAISTDGTTWHPIWNALDQPSAEWDNYSIDLAAQAAAHGLALGANFRIKFQQYGAYPVTWFGGRGWDNIRLSTPASNDDYYAIQETAGNLIQLATYTPAGPSGDSPNNLDPKIELYSPAGAVLASDDNSGSGRNARLSYTASTTGLYKVHVLAMGGSYGQYVLDTHNVTPPTVATAANASPNPVTGTTTSLSVLGADAATGEASLTYTWSETGPGSVTFTANGSNSAKNSAAIFTTAGTYVFTATITDPGGLAATSNVSVTVNQTLTAIAVNPPSAGLFCNQTQQFKATANDQFGNALATQPAFTWTTDAGTIGADGLLTAPSASKAGTVTASDGPDSGTSTVVVTANRSYVRYIEYDFAQPVDINHLFAASEVQLKRYGLDGAGSGTVITLDGKWTASGNTKLLVDFGPGGIGGDASSSTGNGYYELALDLDGSGAFATRQHSFRLLGDLNGDGTVGITDFGLMRSTFNKSGPNLPGDTNADNTVDITDFGLLRSSWGHTLNPGLPLGAVRMREAVGATVLIAAGEALPATDGDRPDTTVMALVQPNVATAAPGIANPIQTNMTVAATYPKPIKSATIARGASATATNDTALEMLLGVRQRLPYRLATALD